MKKTPPARPASHPAARHTEAHVAPGGVGEARAAKGRRIQVRRSGVHGKGVYAIRPIPAGETIIEYKGEVITWKEALRRHPHYPRSEESRLLCERCFTSFSMT